MGLARAFEIASSTLAEKFYAVVPALCDSILLFEAY